MEKPSTNLIKPIPKHDGYYASTDGSIYSCWVNKGIHGLVKEGVLKELRCSRANKCEHRMIRLGGRKGKWKLVHRIIYETFNGEIPEGMVIRHKNDIPYDNRLENLLVGTQTDNMQDAIKSGRFIVGSKHALSKLTEEDVLYIRSMAGKISHEQMAKKFNVTRRAISHVISRTSWKHVNEKENVHVK